MSAITSLSSKLIDGNSLISLFYLFSVSSWKALTQFLSINYDSELHLNKESISPY